MNRWGLAAELNASGKSSFRMPVFLTLGCRTPVASLFVAGLLACGVSLTLAAPAKADPRSVVELFTSQGCSSCPAADKLFGQLATSDSKVIALSVPIDYWDYIGWKDTLAKPGHSVRQRGYARARGDREVYTPQAVINGVTQALGSDRAAIERAITKSRRNPATLSVPVDISVADGKLTVKVAAGTPQNQSATVWLCSVASVVPVKIGRGENRGRTVAYHNVVRHWTKLGEWNGKDASFAIPLSEVKVDGADEAVVMVQNGSRERPGVMLGTAIAALK
jgi:hypothetical protein